MELPAVSSQGLTELLDTEGFNIEGGYLYRFGLEERAWLWPGTLGTQVLCSGYVT